MQKESILKVYVNNSNHRSERNSSGFNVECYVFKLLSGLFCPFCVGLNSLWVHSQNYLFVCGILS